MLVFPSVTSQYRLLPADLEAVACCHVRESASDLRIRGRQKKPTTNQFIRCWRGMVAWPAQDQAAAKGYREALAAGEMKNQLAGASIPCLS
jgi:hypothetical protein